MKEFAGEILGEIIDVIIESACDVAEEGQDVAEK